MNKSRRSTRRRLSPIRSGEIVDYRNTGLLRRFISEQGKILSRRINKLTSKQQRSLTVAIKRARVLAPSPLTNNENQVIDFLFHSLLPVPSYLPGIYHF